MDQLMLPKFTLVFLFAPLLINEGLAAKRNIWSVGDPQGHVDIIETLPLAEEFWNDYMIADKGVGRPVLLKGAAKIMPAWEKWRTDKSLKKHYAKEKMDQVETEKVETRTKYPHEDWKMAKFLDNYNKSNIYSTSATPKGMQEDVFLLPPFSCGGYSNKLSATVLWMSSGSTRSVVHKDGQHNQHCMLAGSKNWILWHPREPIDSKTMGWTNADEEMKKDPAFKDTYGTFGGRVNVDDMEETIAKYPQWDKMKWWNMTLNAGDCAYIPPAWYHFVEAPAQRSISVHVWFHSEKKFNKKGCAALEGKGYDLSSPIFRLSDCTFGFGETKKKTKCNLPKQTKAGKSEL